MTVEELVSEWGFEIDNKPLEVLNKRFGEIKATVTNIAIGVTAAAGTMFGFAKYTANLGEEIGNMVQKTGVGARELQRMQFAAKVADVEAGSFAQGLKFLAKNLVEAKDGSKEAQKSFADLGIDPSQFTNVEELMQAVSARFEKMPDGPKKTAAALSLFSRSGNEMIPFLNLGPGKLKSLGDEFESLGGVMSDDLIDQSDKFNEQLDLAYVAIGGVQKIVGAALMPVIKELVMAFTQFIKENKKFIALRLGQIFAALATYVKITWQFATRLYTALAGVVQVLGGVERVAYAAAVAFGIFAAVKTLMGIGNLAIALAGVIAKLLAMNALTLAANASMLIMPILVGAALVALGLVIEDIVGFFQGRDSVTGMIVDKFKEMFAFLEEGWANMGQPIKTFAALLLSTVIGPIRMIILGVRTLAAVMGTLAGGGSMSDVFELVKGAGASMVRGNLGTGTMSDMFGFGDIENKDMGISKALGIGPTTNPLPGRGGAGNSQSIVSPITVNMGNESDPFKVGKAVQRGASDAWGPALRGAEQSFGGASGSY